MVLCEIFCTLNHVKLNWQIDLDKISSRHRFIWHTPLPVRMKSVKCIEI